MKSQDEKQINESFSFIDDISIIQEFNAYKDIGDCLMKEYLMMDY
jgi:hypothetical protein